MANTIEEAVVRKSVRVQAPVERAFSVFVEQMETWWPATHHIGKTPFEAIFVEPRVGGRWYERNAEGRLCDWGTVLAWDPPHRVRLLLACGPGHDTPDWKFDPDMAKASEVEIRFSADGPGPRWSSWNTASWSATAKDTSSCARSSMVPAPGAASWKSLPRGSKAKPTSA